MATEFIYRGATLHDEPGLIVVFESNPVVLRRDAAHFGWDLAELERQNKIKIIATSPQVLDQGVRSSSGVLLQTARDMGARRIFIDNIALLGAMALQNHAPANGKGNASRREIFQHLAATLSAGVKPEAN